MKLLEPIMAGGLTLRNRIVMAPMSRRRSENGVPNEMMEIYYAQRADAGLIITESAAVSNNSMGYTRLAGIYNEAQTAGWKKVTNAVHKKGGKIFMQLVHAGRIGHPLNFPEPGELIGPSAIAATGEISTVNGVYPYPIPRELSLPEVKAIIEEHLQAARNARDAGFDGIEVHAAHGYLAEQFLHPHSNRRTDNYGGSIENRSRFLLEITAGIVDIFGAANVGIRFSPFALLNDLPAYEEEIATHLYLVPKLNELDIRYIHLSDQSTNGHPPIPPSYSRLLREQFNNWLILSGGYNGATAENILLQEDADLIGFGRPFISNPDLVNRIRHGFPLTPGNKDTYYEGGASGLIDYPCMTLPQ